MKATTSSKNFKLKLLEFIPQFVQKLPEKLPHLIMSGIPALLSSDKDEASIGKVLEENAIKFSNKNALLFEDRKWTHRELNEISNQYAHLFHHVGVKKGQVVIVFLENRPEVIFIVAALAKLGAIASLINSNQKSNVLKHSINQKNDGFFIVGAELSETFNEIRGEIVSPGFQVFLGVEDQSIALPKDDFLSVNEILNKFPITNFPDVQTMTSGTPFAFVFTSGTTGLPKAAIQTHRKWLSCMSWFGKINLNLNSDDVIYVSIPFYHSNALLIAWSSAAASGAAMAVRRKFSVNEFWKDCIHFRATAFIYIGDICRYLYNAAPSDLDQKHSIKKIVGNGLRPDIWQEFKERFNLQEIYEFYASSEGNMTFTNTFNLNNTVGWCVSKFEIIKYDRENGEPIYDKNGFLQKVKWGEIGLMIFEISDRFPFPGYVNEEDNSKKVFKNAFSKGDMWYNTGDIMRNIGFLHTQFVDREGDTFRWKGENVSTAEVEEVLNAFPSIDSSCVYGVEIPFSDGKAGMAAIQLRKNAELNWQEFEDYLNRELPSYAIPIFIRFENEFQYTSTYKVIKSQLKNEGFEKSSTPVWVKLKKNTSYQELDNRLLETIREVGI
ncbi:MAG TPA: long-chain-acyl-CoA synthetase [Chitinophagales bacterium]|nr:long-chain-acyl-CoA synthetase [Chitinophagales bacterium]